MAIHLSNENVWFDQYKFMDAERDYYCKLAQRLVGGEAPAAPAAPSQRAKSPLIEQISHASIPGPIEKEEKAVKETDAVLTESVSVSKPEAEAQPEPTEKKAAPPKENSPLIDRISVARQQIHQSLAAPAKSGGGDGGAGLVDVTNRLQKLELENSELRQVTNDLKNMVTKLSSRVEQLEKKAAAPAAAPAAVPAPKPAAAPAPAAPARPVKKVEEEEEDDDDDDFDMFGSDDEEDEEAEKIKQERVAAYAAKKSKKPALIAKSSVLLDVKPWDDETDMAELEKNVRTIEMDGLLWGQGRLQPVGYGISKLVINCVVEDDKVSIEELSEKIEEFEDFVQSVDVAAFNKI